MQPARVILKSDARASAMQSAARRGAVASEPDASATRRPSFGAPFRAQGNRL
jgi:hypothetical protein